MPEYSLGFSEKLIEAVGIVHDNDPEEPDAKRTVLYLSLLSAEICIKAALEQAGCPISVICKKSHNLGALLELLGQCELQKDIGNGVMRSVNASRIRAVTVDANYDNATVGTLLTGEEEGASVYPNQIRYGDAIEHYPPEVVLAAATLAFSWVKKHFDSMVYAPKNI